MGANTTKATALPGGPTLDGTGVLPPDNTQLPLLQTAINIGPTAITVDVSTMVQGATAIITHVDPPGTAISNYHLAADIPSLGISNLALTDSGSSPTGAEAFTAPLSGGRTFEADIAPFSYTVLGLWSVRTSPTNFTNAAAFVTGYRTRNSSVPTSGSSTYNGVTIGAVGAPSGLSLKIANLVGLSSLTANFANGTITGSLSSMSTIPLDGSPQAPWNTIGINGTFNSADFTGVTTVTGTASGIYAMKPTAQGTINGSFFGPNVDEVGAVWSISDGTNGAYGAMGGVKSVPSDRRLKRDIEWVRTLDSGVNIYAFRYLNDDQRFLGVMAQDLLANPAFASAVHTDERGVYSVDYDQLGLRIVGGDAMLSAGQAAVRAYESAGAASPH